MYAASVHVRPDHYCSKRCSNDVVTIRTMRWPPDSMCFDSLDAGHRTVLSNLHLVAHRLETISTVHREPMSNSSRLIDHRLDTMFVVPL